ncbi:MAG TPA: amino acid permease [Chthoniobacterales bacterium]
MGNANDPAPDAAISDDVKLLASLGYKQELQRRMSAFSNFAISFSIICILAGGITSLQLGTSAIGGAAAGVAWPIGTIFAFFVALCMAQVASAYPTAGGLYHWSSILGGKGWGWATAWFNFLGVVFVTAAVNVGIYTLFINLILPLFGVDPTKLTPMHQLIGVTLITGSHALFNHLGIKVTTLLTDFSGYLILFVSIALTISMLAFAPSHDFSRLFQFSNFSGDAGGGVWPANSHPGMMLLLALLWPIYTITGFDASAHTSEETVNAAENVPKGILRSVWVSGVFGFVMVASFIIALPSVPEGVAQGGNIFFWLLDKIIPAWLQTPLKVGIVIANYLCGLACVTSTSRMAYAFARDGGLPSFLKKVSPKFGTPAAAIWVGSAAAVATTLYTPAYTTLTVACVIFLYMSYCMPTIVGIFAYGKSWTKMGPFDLGGPLYKTVGIISILGVLAVIYAGIQPPNDKALPVTAITAIALFLAWHVGVKKKFAGPPMLAEVKKAEPESPLAVDPAL